MASSRPHLIEKEIIEIMNTNPASVLDVGIGFGKWGFLMREYLEAWKRRIYPEQWKTRIEGVDIWRRFTQKLPWIQQLYDKIYVGDIVNIIDQLPQYDLILMNHIVEHMWKGLGTKTVRKVMEHAKQKLIISLPIEGKIGGHVIDGNKYEKHVSSWTIAEVEALATDDMVFRKKHLVDKWAQMSAAGMFIFERKK